MSLINWKQGEVCRNNKEKQRAPFKMSPRTRREMEKSKRKKSTLQTQTTHLNFIEL